MDRVSELRANINGLNLYAYGLNNPNKFYDPTGKNPLLLILLLIGVGGIVGGAAINGAIDAKNAADSGADFWGATGAFFGGAWETFSKVGQQMWNAASVYGKTAYHNFAVPGWNWYAKNSGEISVALEILLMATAECPPLFGIVFAAYIGTIIVSQIY